MRTPLTLTVGEVATLVSRLAGVSCSARRVRYLLGGPVQGHGRTRFYTALDVAVVQLVLRLEQAGVSPWVGRVVIAYLGDELRAALRAGARGAVRIQGVRAELVAVNAHEQSVAATAFVPLADIWRGVVPAVRRIRTQRPTVWMWREMSAGDAMFA